MPNLLYPSELLCSPIVYPLENQTIKNNISCVFNDEVEILNALKEDKAELGFISPLAYAKSQGVITILNDFIVSSPHSGKNSLLFFKGDLKTIQNIIYSGSSSLGDFHRIIADYVLREIFDVAADWNEIPDLEMSDQTMNKYEVVFLSGNMAYDNYIYFDNFIDMTEEWSLKMNLPVVHLLLCASPSFSDSDVINQVRLAREIGIRNLMKISKSHADTHASNWNIYFDLLDKNYRYFPEMPDWQSLQKILEYMFYSNVVDYLPEIKFYTVENSGKNL